MSNYDTFKNAIGDMHGYVVAALTDEYIVSEWPSDVNLEQKFDKALEIRVFNNTKEVKLFRGDIGKEFALRIIDDNAPETGVESYEEAQFLDIDTSDSNTGKTIVTTTGGGKFYLPVGNHEDAKVVIKYYLKKDSDSGMAQVYDWRLVDFKEA